MEIVFEVREAEGSGYTAQAVGHAIFTEADSWEELRANALEAATLHFEDSDRRPKRVHLHLVKDETIDVQSGKVVAECHSVSCLKAMKPESVTTTKLSSVLAELIAREPIFHRPELGKTRAEFEHMTVDDYWETGASGRRYSRTAILDELDKRFAVPHNDAWETMDFHCRRLSEDTYLLTYTLLQDKQRLTRRATIWRYVENNWKIVYHQGTIVQHA